MHSPVSSATTASPLKFWLYASLIVLLALLLKIVTLRGEIMMDDRLLITMPDQRGCDTNIADCFQNPLFHLYYRPVLSASFLLGIRLHGTEPFWFHADNLLLHGLGVGVWITLFRRLFCSERTALVAGLLFALHPVQVSVTGFIGGRTDTLALALLGLSLLSLVWTVNVRKTYYIVSLLCFALAVFTKEQIALSVLLLPSLLSMVTPHLTKRQRLLYAAPYALILAFYAIIAKTILPSNFLPRLGIAPSLHTEIIGRTLWYYAKTLTGIAPSAFHQSSLGAWSPNQWQTAVLGYTLLFGWASFYLFHARKELRLKFCWWWVSLTLLPCVNLILTPSQFVAPYRVPLALPGLVGIIALFYTKFAVEHSRTVAKITKATLCVWATLYGLLTLQEAFLWCKEIPVLQTMTRVDPNFLPAHLWLGNAYQQHGQFSQALEEYSGIWNRLRLADISPEQKLIASRERTLRERVWNLCGWSYSAPRFTGWILYQEGRTLLWSGDYAKAIASLKPAFEHDRNEDGIRQSLAYAYIETQQYVLAQNLLFIPSAGKPDALDWQFRGYYFAKQERWEMASDALNRAWEAQPPLDSRARETNRKLFAYVQRRLAQR